MKKVVILLLICILFSGCSIRKTDELTNSQKFDNEYAVGENNSFTYVSIDELEDLFESGTGLLFFGNSDCEWCIKSVTILNKLLNRSEVKEVLYFNPMTLNDTNKDKLLYLINEEIENIEISSIKMPSLYVIVDGVIVDYDDSSLESIDEDNDKEVKKYEKRYLELIEKYKENV